MSSCSGPKKWVRGLAGNAVITKNGSTQFWWLKQTIDGPVGKSSAPSTLNPE